MLLMNTAADLSLTFDISSEFWLFDSMLNTEFTGEVPLPTATTTVQMLSWVTTRTKTTSGRP